MLRAGKNIVRRALFKDFPLVHEQNSVGRLAGKAHFMRDHDHGHAVAGKIGHDVEHFARHFRIKGGGRLVEQHDARFHGQRPDDGRALLLSAGKLVGEGVFFVGKARAPEQGVGQIGGLGARHAAQADGAEHQIFQHIEVRKEIERLERCIRMAKDEWKVEVYLEPGEAWALNAGFLLTRVLDVLKNGETEIAIVDASAACHMPDVLEMPYLPPLLGADDIEERGTTVRLGGPTCLSGDVIGDYKFRQFPEYGDLLMFGDMAIYTTCKNNTFNGMPLPDIWLRRADSTMQQLTDFGYGDFKGRLGSRK